MAKTNIVLPKPKARRGGCQNDCFDNQTRIAASKTAASATVVQLRPTTILTTRGRSATRAGVGDKRTYLTENEVEELMKAAPTARDRTMILVGYTHGLRVSELVNLRWSQIKFDTGRIAVKRLKKGEDSEHVLRGREIRALKALRREQPAGSQFVFLSYQVAPMTRQAFDKMLRAAAARAGISDVHAHLLRHGCGYRLVNTGMDTLSLAAYLGHANVQNTKLYTKMNASRFEGLWQD